MLSGIISKKQVFFVLAISLLTGGLFAQNENINALIPKMELVLRGTFWQGSVEPTFASSETARKTSLHSFMIASTETTQALWEAVMGKNPSAFKGATRPVERLSWFEAVEFCNRLSVLQGLEPAYTISGSLVQWDKSANGYRLPTEAEWEYAARGGSQVVGLLERASASPGYAGSSNANEVAIFAANAGNKTWPVGSKKPNELGLYDMSGNVWEWCWDFYGSYPATAVDNPDAPSQRSASRVIRGGAWFTPLNLIRTTYRFWSEPRAKINTIGFRLARNADPISELERMYTIELSKGRYLDLYDLLDAPKFAPHRFY